MFFSTLSFYLMITWFQCWFNVAILGIVGHPTHQIHTKPNTWQKIYLNNILYFSLFFLLNLRVINLGKWIKLIIGKKLPTVAGLVKSKVPSLTSLPHLVKPILIVLHRGGLDITYCKYALIFYRWHWLIL